MQADLLEQAILDEAQEISARLDAARKDMQNATGECSSGPQRLRQQSAQVSSARHKAAHVESPSAPEERSSAPQTLRRANTQPIGVKPRANSAIPWSKNRKKTDIGLANLTGARGKKGAVRPHSATPEGPRSVSALQKLCCSQG